jgi:hypothetical protein
MRVGVLLTSASRTTEDRSFRSFNILLTKLHSIFVRLDHEQIYELFLNI